MINNVQMRRPSRKAALASILFAGAVLAFAVVAEAQQPKKVPQIGFLLSPSPSASGFVDRIEAFRQALRERGYIEGQNIAIEYRWAEGRYERLPILAAELVSLKVDILLTQATPGTRAAKQATTTIPIVMVVSGDAIATGLVSSLARPGGNITGTTYFAPELAAKRLELLKEAVPRIRRVAVLINPDNPINASVQQAVETTAKLLKVELQQVEIRGPSEFDGAFSAMANKRVDALSVIEDPMLIANVRPIADLVTKKRLPSIAFGEFAEAGGLMAYGVNFLNIYRRAAFFVDKILKGTKPADIPVEQPTKFDFVINLKTAKQIGVSIPHSVLYRADKVIK